MRGFIAVGVEVERRRHGRVPDPKLRVPEIEQCARDVCPDGMDHRSEAIAVPQTGAGFITSGAHSRFTTVAGLPETIEYGGTLSVTKAPPAILLPRPIL